MPVETKITKLYQPQKFNARIICSYFFFPLWALAKSVILFTKSVFASV